MAGRGRAQRQARPLHPARVVAGGFGSAVVVGAGLLSLPIATESGERASLIDALFTATSAVCVTGLITVDTGGHWLTFGEVVILALIQAGGLGIMTLGTMLALLVSRRLGLRARLTAQLETKQLSAGNLRQVVRNIVLFSLICEAVVMVMLTVRLATAYDRPFGTAVYEGLFHSVSAFNNAGFALYADSLMGFVSDPWIILPIALAVIVGGLGFPVVFELTRAWRRPRTWSVLTRLTLGISLALLVFGTIAFTAAEWNNPHTLGPLDGGAKWMSGFFASVMPRTAGFNSLDVSAMLPESWVLTDVLMFIGGGSAGTAGGIKVTTFGLLAFVIWSELRGHTKVNIGHRSIPESTQRQALTIALLSVGLVVVSTVTLYVISAHELDKVVFEAISAFATVGLSTGITADLPTAAHALLAVLMFIGRVGPLTLGSALALREHARRYELPEERPIVG
ncbi:TrkH family potassium uptake protein [Flindersiella endophytica]